MKKFSDKKVKKIYKMGIAKRVTIVYAFIIVLLVFIFGKYYITRQRIDIYDKAQRYADSGLEYVKRNIEINTDIMMQVALTIMSDTDLMELISIKEEATAAILLESKDTINSLSGYCALNPQISSVKVYYNNINLEPIPPYLVSINELDERYWYQDFRDSDMLSTFCYTSQGNGYIGQKDTVSLYSKIIYRNRICDSVIEVDMKMEDFLSYQEREDAELDVRFFFLKEDGTVIEGTTLEEDKVQEISETIKQELIQNKENNCHIGDAVVSCQYMDALDVWLVAYVDTREAMLESMSFQVMVIILLLLTVVVLYIIVSFLTSRMLRRLVLLQKIMQSGEMTFDVDAFGYDEIGELALHYSRMLKNICCLMEENTRVQIDLKNTEIQALQAQINSHFMYNALESIGMLAMMHDDAETAEAIGVMGKITRYNLDWSSAVVQLQDELEHVINYMELISIRENVQKQKMELYTNVSSDLMELRIPKMVLQPIVENAVLYSAVGKCKGKDIKISITACRIDQNTVAIDVVDDGKGIVQEELVRLRNLFDKESEELSNELINKSGIGLVNINLRLKLYYGTQYGLRIDSVRNTFTRVRILVPYHSGEEIDKYYGMCNDYR